MLWKRLVSAFVPLPIILGTLHLAPTWAWALLISLFVAVAHWEYLTITGAARSRVERGALVVAGLGVYFACHFARPYFGEMILAIVLGSFLWVLARPGEITSAFPRTAAMTTGFVYVPLLFSFLVALHTLPHGVAWVYVAFIVAWLGDTGAYFAGRAFGRHKLYPLVSPKKTWEGAVGGLAGSFLGLLVHKFAFFDSLTVIDCALIAIPGGVLGQAGDLCESLLKRSYDVKDSGAIMPGHGGILDRADALLFVMPYVFVYAVRVHPFPA
jgi:phosphatidate cytidylyltransferase